VGRVPVILAICLLGMSVLLRWLLDSVFADLGATRQREQEAMERARFDQRRFADFSEIAADWFWETDAQLRMIYISPSLTEHTGLQPEKLLGQHPLAFVRKRHPESARLREIEGKMARGEPFSDELLAWHDESGKVMMFRHVGRAFRDGNGRLLGYRGAATDITENWRLTRELELLARTDSLTGLLNRRAFGEALSKTLAQARESGSSWWLLQLDLDHFKQVNDRSGHGVGDQVLIKVAELLRQSGMPTETLARVGGDEFCALVREPEAEALADYADLILAGFARLASEFGQPIGASIGIARLHPENGDESFQLRVVDEACYEAKREGRGRVVIA
jgi:diguanylate cyclase (GGDEF)-like protein/PAS domain S-box-containing protein